MHTVCMAARPEVPQVWIDRLDRMLTRHPECRQEKAWVGVRWQVGQASVAHVFGGEDGAFRIVFRAELEEVMAFQHMGGPYFKTDWGSNVVGMILDETTDWDELAELLTASYCVQAPQRLAEAVRGASAHPRPG